MHEAEKFPFRILGFHSDNGSEFINTIVARLLSKLLDRATLSYAWMKKTLQGAELVKTPLRL